MKLRASAFSKGFTLVEIMLVMVVMSLMASLLVVSISNNPLNELEDQAKRLQAVLQMGQDEAVFQGVELALALVEESVDSPKGYQFLFFDVDNQSWNPMVGKPFGFYELEEPLVIDIELLTKNSSDQFQQQIERIKSQSVALVDASKSLQPSLLMLSSGEMTPFAITLSHQDVDKTMQVVSDGLSSIELQ